MSTDGRTDGKTDEPITIVPFDLSRGILYNDNNLNAMTTRICASQYIQTRTERSVVN